MPGLSPADASAVVVPTGKDGAPDASKAAAATPMKGGMMLSPLPLGGGKRRKTRRLSKKVLKMLKKMPKAKLAKMMKGAGEDGEEAVMGGRRKTARKPRRSTLLY